MIKAYTEEQNTRVEFGGAIEDIFVEFHTIIGAIKHEILKNLTSKEDEANKSIMDIVAYALTDSKVQENKDNVEM